MAQQKDAQAAPIGTTTFGFIMISMQMLNLQFSSLSSAAFALRLQIAEGVC